MPRWTPARYRDKVMVTTLPPAGIAAACPARIGAVVGREPHLAGGIDWLRENGVKVIDLDDRECRELLESFIVEHPEVWNEDIGEE